MPNEEDSLHSTANHYPMNHISCIIFDFAGTLCSDYFFTGLKPEYFNAVQHLIFGENSTKWADPWMAGELSSRDIAGYLSSHWPITEEEVLRTLYDGCSKMTFNPAVWRFAQKQKQSGRKIALVTLNMDVFTEIIVPSHNLDTTFDVIVNSSDHKELDKTKLFQTAFDLLGSNQYTFHTSLLIDDSQKQVDAFRRMGGMAYRYVGDAAFEEWVNVSVEDGEHPTPEQRTSAMRYVHNVKHE
jgi:FMN phosphatase YigB (HAD superfamily)